jgi:hypothetical protein
LGFGSEDWRGAVVAPSLDIEKILSFAARSLLEFCLNQHVFVTHLQGSRASVHGDTANGATPRAMNSKPCNKHKGHGISIEA